MKKANPKNNDPEYLADLKAYQERQRLGMAQLKKAIRLKDEFYKLQYPERLKFMEENFDGITGILNKESETVISVSPDEKDPEQIRQFNEWQIKKYEGFEGELFDDYFFERIKARFERNIEQIKECNDFPGDLIRAFVVKELDVYSERVKDPLIKREIDFYNGNWDLSRKVIDTWFLRAWAYSNYIPFLKDQLKNGFPNGKSENTKGKGKKTFPEYFINVPEEKRISFADQLKSEFRNIKGKRLRYMIEALKELDILYLEERQSQQFYDAMNDYFKWDLGAKWFLFDPKTISLNDEPGRVNDKPNIEKAKKRIQLIIGQINKG